MAPEVALFIGYMVGAVLGFCAGRFIPKLPNRSPYNTTNPPQTGITKP